MCESTLQNVWSVGQAKAIWIVPESSELESETVSLHLNPAPNCVLVAPLMRWGQSQCPRRVSVGLTVAMDVDTQPGAETRSEL